MDSKNKILLGITGYKQSGKDTIANYLIQKYSFEKYAFAYPLKEICKCAFNLTEEQLNGKDKEVKDEFWKTTPRIMMQKIGDIMRNNLDFIPEIKNNYFVKYFEDYYQKKSPTRLVVSDIRFLNEASSVKKLKGMIIKVIRKSADEKTDQHISTHATDDNRSYENLTFDLLSKSHVSEVEMDKIKDYNFIIENNGSLEELYQKVDKIMQIFLCQ